MTEETTPENYVKPVLDIHEKPAWNKWIVLSIQHLFTMFGSTIFVPTVTGLNPSVALISSGLGTLAYLIITRGKIPAYLGSSFAFIAPITMLLTAKSGGGPGAVMVGTFSVGVVYAIVALLVYYVGIEWIKRVLPPIVVGPVIMVIGLSLAPSAAAMAMGTNNGGEYDYKILLVALITLVVTIVAMMFFKGFFGLIPILCGFVIGYLVSMAFGLVDYTLIQNASLFQVPDFTVPFVNMDPVVTLTVVLSMAPLAFVTMAEHMGHQLLLNRITNRNFFKDPGLHRSLAADGTASIIASLIGGPPVTTYGENIGVLAITKVYSVFVIGGAAVLAIAFGFIGYINAVITSVPTAVLGGISLLLFGVIATSGLRMMIESHVDLSVNRNMIIASVVLVVGIGGLLVEIGSFKLEGMAMAALLGIILNLVLPEAKAHK
ncbi:uracil permease [Listeria newyorkensis]|uniref:Uracil permease n=1 Tax=Listeria newyorkensis TaxID=1497681 RepID=A0ABX4XN72_9LIST|nr:MULTISPECIES: solute carrier family 23 protein [Listeria]KGL44916.1 uracil permease [Listeriaceae bacterium FSL A5-0209]KGL40959.1 uracil permease [Listeria newyorkensis]PNP92442.1 uracil permease [Listeria newyorkensis]RQW68377.1 uracil permease [Listeria sp. SHR_NRA_18]WAO21393.1 NCS2 family nucleobase:cation symporter [Listeria newyorkensis]